MEGRCFENNLNYQYDEIFLHRTISKTISYLWNEVLKHSDLPDSNCLYDGKAGELYWLTQLSSSLSIHSPQSHSSLRPHLQHSLPGVRERAQRLCNELKRNIKRQASGFRHRPRCASLICGLAGEILAVWQYLHTVDPDSDTSRLLDLYWDLCHHSIAATDPSSSFSINEILYGRAGLLMGCTVLARNGNDNPSCRRGLIRRILQEGKAARNNLGTESSKRQPPLVYTWHEKIYLGAAHGYAGILAAFLANWSEVPDMFHNDIRQTLDWTLSLITSNANVPSSVTHAFRARFGKDQLVHWCHGAPGMIPTLCLAHGVFGDKRYLKTARDLAETVWRFGLLRKGWGLCHGAPGNAYAFLALYDATGDDRYLKRAEQFALWLCCSPDAQNIADVPDRPLGLYTGVCGAGQFLLDLLALTTIGTEQTGGYALPFLVAGPAGGYRR